MCHVVDMAVSDISQFLRGGNAFVETERVCAIILPNGITKSSGVLSTASNAFWERHSNIPMLRTSVTQVVSAY